MDTFVLKLRAGDERDYVQRKFEVISFEYENDFMWFFTVRAIEEKIHGRIYPIHAEPKIMGFQKKEQTGEKRIVEDGIVRKVPVFSDLPAPLF